MKNEKMKLSKLESIQMSNFLMKKEISSYLENKNLTQFSPKKFSIFISNFIEDLFNILNQQILTCSQIYESTSKSQVEHLISNNKSISYTMILNFYEKIFSYLINIKNKPNLSRNFSNNNINNKKVQNLTEKYNNINEFERNYFNKKYNTHFNSPKNSFLQNSLSNFNSSSNILVLSSPNTSKNVSEKNLKLDFIDLNKLEKNKEKDEIQIFVKQKKNKENNKIKNVNNKIVLTKKIYKVYNPIPASKNNLFGIESMRKNSFNKKIKCNKINIKKSKNNFKSINISNSVDNKK